MRSFGLFLVASVMSQASTLVQAKTGYFIDGNELKRICDQGSPNCTSYILGVFDTITFFVETKRDKAYICTPAEIDGSQLRDIVKRYLADNPESRHLFASVHVYAALAKAYPCPQQQR